MPFVSRTSERNGPAAAFTCVTMGMISAFGGGVVLLPGATGLRTATISPGLKWNLAGTWVLLANVLVPLTQGGLTAPITPFVGIDYAFGR